MAIELVTFGGLHILDDEGELDWLAGQRTRAALLIYLAVERRVSREALTTVFWPESDAENARHALRQSLYHLKKAVSSDWVESLSHDLAVTDDVRADVHEFMDAVASGNLESAVRLYRGPFLDGVHLVDLTSWEGWVDSRRAQYARTFRKASRDLFESHTSAGNLRGAVEVAELWAARDALDDEAQHRLIEALANAGERAEAIRQYETYSRARESDGLEPSRETRDLVERLRADVQILPPINAGITPVQPAPAERKRFPSQRLVLAGAIAVFAILAFWGLSRARSTPVPVSSSVAVLPFTVRGGPSVAYLREGMVNLLAAAFDGAGSLRSIDTRATFAAASNLDAQATDLSKADETAGRLGAAMFVVGDIVESGHRLQMEGAIYRRGTSAPSAKAVVSGSSDSVFALTDRLAAQLLAGLSDPADRLVRTASVTTSSLPAFKEYLQGDRLMRAGQFERAADSYQAAIAHDSTFAIAYYRLGLAREWAPLLGADQAAAASARYANRLTLRDRDLLNAFRAWRSGNAVEAQRSYHAIIARYPDDLDAWFQLGEIQFHQGPLLGNAIEASEESWRKLLSYEPRNLFAVTHLARIGLISGRIALVDSLLSAFSSTERRTDRRLAEIVLLRAVTRRDMATINAITGDMRKWEDLSVWRVAVFLTAFTTNTGTMRGIVETLGGKSASPALRADMQWFVSLLDLSEGRLTSARIAVERAAEAERLVPSEYRRDGFEPVMDWFAATLPLPYPDSTVMRARDRARSLKIAGKSNGVFDHETRLGGTIQLEPLRQYTVGVLSLRVQDTVSAASAARRLSEYANISTATVLTRDLDRGLRARLAFQNGRKREALRILEQLEQKEMQGDVTATPFAARAAERFLRAELLASMGRNTEALAWLASLGYGSVSEIPLRGLAHLRQAEIHDRLGSRQHAAVHYAKFLELWESSDAVFQPVVQSARQRLSILRSSNAPKRLEGMP